jgi:hypothetical protein
VLDLVKGHSRSRRPPTIRPGGTATPALGQQKTPGAPPDLHVQSDTASSGIGESRIAFLEKGRDVPPTYATTGEWPGQSTPTPGSLRLSLTCLGVRIGNPKQPSRIIDDHRAEIRCAQATFKHCPNVHSEEIRHRKTTSTEGVSRHDASIRAQRSY